MSIKGHEFLTKASITICPVISWFFFWIWLLWNYFQRFLSLPKHPPTINQMALNQIRWCWENEENNCQTLCASIKYHKAQTHIRFLGAYLSREGASKVHLRANYKSLSSKGCAYYCLNFLALGSNVRSMISSFLDSVLGQRYPKRNISYV